MEKGSASTVAEELIRAHYEEIYRYCYWHTHERRDAEDLTQETFLHFLRSAADSADILVSLLALPVAAHSYCRHQVV